MFGFIGRCRMRCRQGRPFAAATDFRLGSAVLGGRGSLGCGRLRCRSLGSRRLGRAGLRVRSGIPVAAVLRRLGLALGAGLALAVRRCVPLFGSRGAHRRSRVGRIRSSEGQALCSERKSCQKRQHDQDFFHRCRELCCCVSAPFHPVRRPSKEDKPMFNGMKCCYTQENASSR